MKGPGKGNWGPRAGRKTPVEDALGVSVRTFARLPPVTSGVIRWERGGRDAGCSVGFAVEAGPGGRAVVLSYRLAGGEAARVQIRMFPAPARLGGVRWWLACPGAGSNGAACGRRVARLYRPPGARSFACRHCHGLTYRTSQEAHFLARMARRLGLEL